MRKISKNEFLDRKEENRNFDFRGYATEATYCIYFSEIIRPKLNHGILQYIENCLHQRRQYLRIFLSLLLN